MKHFTHAWWSLVALMCLASLPRAAHADVPALLPVQGYLTDSSDVALDGNYNVSFRLYNAPTGGTKLHEELIAVSVADGYFTAYLGDDSLQPLDMAALRDAAAVFMTIDVDVDNNGSGDGESVPRLQIAANAFAFQAEYCEDAQTLAGKSPSDFSDSAHAHAWSEITSKPGTFTPSAHDHGADDVTSGTLDPARFSCYADLGAEGYLDNSAAGDVLLQSQGDARYAAASHNHSGSSITSGAVGNAYFSAYSDLGAEGYLDNNAAADLLLQSQGDARYAATSHNHSWSQITSGVPTTFTPSAHTHGAADISSGTLDPARYSAYTDLGTDGFLDNNAAGDLLTRTQSDGRYLNLTGGTVTGAVTFSSNVAVTGTLTANAIQLAAVRTGYVTVGATEFRTAFVTAPTSYSVYDVGQLGYPGDYPSSTIITTGTIYLQAGVQLPDGATVTELRCFFADISANNDFDLMSTNLYRSATNSTSVSSVATATASGLAALNSATLQEYSSVAAHAVDNSTGIYSLRHRMSVTTTTWESLYFRGCRITYTTTQP